MTDINAIISNDYQFAMKTARNMLFLGIITKADYVEIEKMMCEKYCIKKSSFSRDYGSNPLDNISV